MTTLLWLWLLSCARSHPGQPEDKMPSDTQPVQATVTCADETATATVAVIATTEPLPHMNLASALAHHTLTEHLLAGGRWPEAAGCAREGCAVLGKRYRPPRTEDDTQMKIFAAEDLIEKGRAEDGANLLSRMLAERIGLYRERHADTLGD